MTTGQAMSPETKTYIADWDPATVHQIAYRNASPSGRAPAGGILDVVAVEATGLGELDAVIVTGDLQFREFVASPREARPIGEVVAEDLSVLCDLEMLPPACNTGVVLTGDLYCDPTLQRRGGMGDVGTVWEAFASRFAFVVGVLGNHDDLQQDSASTAFEVLDVDIVERRHIRIGGVGGIIGSGKRPNRREEQEYLAAVSLVLQAEPQVDLLVLHQAPQFSDDTAGSVGLRDVLDDLARPGTLVVCGHEHWEQPLVTLSSGAQVLNVDGRCVVLLTGEGSPKVDRQQQPGRQKGATMAKSPCCGAPIERRNDGKPHCSECGKTLGR